MSKAENLESIPPPRLRFRILHKLKAKEKVCVVCMDQSPSYRALVAKYFLNALIVTAAVVLRKARRSMG